MTKGKKDEERNLNVHNELFKGAEQNHSSRTSQDPKAHNQDKDLPKKWEKQERQSTEREGEGILMHNASTDHHSVCLPFWLGLY